MSLDPISQLSGQINTTRDTFGTLRQNISPDESEAQEQIVVTENITFSGVVVLNQLTYATDSFIIDHPVLGELDSTYLKLDGGYIGSDGLEFPLAFPLSFGTEAVELARVTI